MTLTARMCWVVAVAAAVCFVALAVIAEIMIEPAGLSIFDSRLAGYSLAEAQTFVVALSEGQRAVYLGLFRGLDTVFPVLLTVSLLGAIWLNTGGEPARTRGAAMAGPVLYASFDLLENAHVARILILGEGVQAPLVETAARYTQAKWMCLALGLLVVFWAWKFAAKGKTA